MLRLNPAAIAGQEEPLETLVAKADNGHAAIVTDRVTPFKGPLDVAR